MTPHDLRRALSEAFQAYTRQDFARAAALLEAALQIAPNDVNALQLLARIRGEQGMTDDALPLLDRAIALAPNSAALHANRAAILLELERWREALGAYERALAQGADRAQIWMGRGLCLSRLERCAEAAASFRRAAERDPDNADAWFNLGRSLQQEKDHIAAAEAYRRAVALRPDDTAMRDNFAVALHQSDCFDLALHQFDEALRLDPMRAETWSNRGLLLFDMGRPQQAIASFDRALAHLGASAGLDVRALRYNRAMAHLRSHDLEAGWPDFELRWSANVGLEVQPPPEPKWTGQPLQGSLRIWREQGIGDEILFARLVPMAQARTPNIVLNCDPRLAPLLARSFPDIVVHAGDTGVGEAQIAIGSLGPVLGIGAAQLDGGAFLRADQARRNLLREKYEALARGRRIVGIAWSSNNATRGALKTAPLEHWSPLLARDFLFINLQYGEAGREAEAVGADLFRDREIDQLRDLDGFAAQVAALDHVVSISNTTVHMAGALGVPCIVMPPPARGRLWYWGYEGEATPWYGSVRIARRGLEEGWATQIGRAAAMLAS